MQHRISAPKYVTITVCGILLILKIPVIESSDLHRKEDFMRKISLGMELCTLFCMACVRILCIPGPGQIGFSKLETVCIHSLNQNFKGTSTLRKSGSSDLLSVSGTILTDEASSQHQAGEVKQERLTLLY